jgi:hypothetical protein
LAEAARWWLKRKAIAVFNTKEYSAMMSSKLITYSFFVFIFRISF